MKSNPLIKLSVLAAAIPVLISCGGGGGGDSTPTNSTAPTPAAATSALTQGRWVGAGATPGYVAIAVPAAAGTGPVTTDTLWALSTDAATLLKLKFNGAAQAAGAITGQVFTLGEATTQAVTNATYAVQTTAGLQLSVQSLPSGTLSLSHSSDMAAGLNAAQANGNWQANMGGVTVSWTAQELALKGTSTSGCTYAGQMTSVNGMGIYKVQFTETCADAALAMTGVATMSPANDRLTVVATNEGETQATALLFVKSP